jgi:hypothetical protein
LKNLGELPKRDEHRIIYVLKSCDDLLIDGVERPIQRAQASDLQKACYSDKKTHNVKKQLVKYS